MSYTPNFNNPYPNGWKDLPNETTPINASALQAHTDAIEADEQYLQSLDATVDGKVSVQGFAKTWSARTWNKGEILYDGGKTYIANTNTAQRPPHADWTQTNLGDEVSAINMSLTNLTTKTYNLSYGFTVTIKKRNGVADLYMTNTDTPVPSGDTSTLLGTIDIKPLITKEFIAYAKPNLSFVITTTGNILVMNKSGSPSYYVEGGTTYLTND